MTTSLLIKQPTTSFIVLSFQSSFLSRKTDRSGTPRPPLLGPTVRRVAGGQNHPSRRRARTPLRNYIIQTDFIEGVIRVDHKKDRLNGRSMTNTVGEEVRKRRFRREPQIIGSSKDRTHSDATEISCLFEVPLNLPEKEHYSNVSLVSVWFRVPPPVPSLFGKSGQDGTGSVGFWSGGLGTDRGRRRRRH